MTRRVFLSGIGSAGAAAAWMRWVEPHWFEVTRTEICIRGARALRILHISDIHVSDGMTAENLEAGVKLGLRERPDLICLTGDFVSTTIGFDEAGLRRMLRRMADAAPALAVLGNHDGGRWLARHGGDGSVNRMSELVQSCGIRLLHNRSVRIGGIRFAGVADLWAGGVDAEAAFAEVDGREATILLSHNPDSKDEFTARHWDLMLSGHTHGGQARIAGMTPSWSPVADKRFLSGLYGWEGRQLFITRGLGSPKHLRAFCRPEVSLLAIANS